MKNLIYILLLIISSNIHPQNRIIVSPSDNIEKILETATAGSTIILKPGIYRVNNLKIDKSLSLIGENYPTIQGNKKDEVITISADDVSVKGLKITDAGISYRQENAAIKLVESSDCVIKNNILENNFFGIYLAKSYNCVIKNNHIQASNKTETSSGNGIHLWYSKGITIEGNTIIGHRDGIYFEFVMHSLVRNNQSKNNLRYGLHFMFSDSCSYINNTFESNGAGVAVMYTKNVTMKQNKFINNWGAASFGVLLKDLTDCLIEKNHFEKNTNGLYLEGCSRITVRMNNFISNGWGIKLMANSMNNYFYENNFVTNSFDILTNSRNNFNDFSGNYWSRYNGYDLDKDGIGDVGYRPVKMFSVIVERQQESMILINSLFIELLNLTESIIPSLTPVNLIDNKPRMREIKF
ncbi:Nitrous oxide reductase accessory protein NosD [Ignavibacterium album JCM 16511]|uniref:Nitrous oxide reductase accessory protein NosD n=1 Tax=Ignavibacterium album (strain DSM 19864 / JCM 16511 / NBRC 101810 / Mat9-16) TaxID=945713 RepID=I0AHV7_IGNAJ|nr:nitrous oxide reductase family maturation protein NosD [Ignavibacterium album]AFH48564.1 Nitrous oxide reductase accessory protein NosD [Ignavibacterium album JCM 16511]